MVITDYLTLPNRINLIFFLYFCRYNCDDVAKLLLHRNADPCAFNKYGSYAIHFAARRGNKEICEEILAKNSVNISAQIDKSGVGIQKRVIKRL